MPKSVDLEVIEELTVMDLIQNIFVNRIIWKLSIGKNIILFNTKSDIINSVWTMYSVTMQEDVVHFEVFNE